MSDEKKKAFIQKIMISKKIPGEIPGNSAESQSFITTPPSLKKEQPTTSSPEISPVLPISKEEKAPPERATEDNSPTAIIQKYKSTLAANNITEEEAFRILKKIFLDDGYWSESYSMFGLNFSFRTRPSIYDRLIAEYMAALDSKNEVFVQYWKVVLSLASSLESIDGKSIAGWEEEDFAERVNVVESLPSMVRDLMYTKVLEFYAKIFTVIYTKGASDFFTMMTDTTT